MTNTIKLSVAIVVLTLVVAAFFSIKTHDAVLGQMWGLNQLYFFELKDKITARMLPRIDGRFGYAANGARSEPPSASTAGGFFAGPVELRLSTTSDPSAAIRYTLDGGIPTQRSRLYEKPILLDRTAVVRFRSFTPGALPSETVTHSYFIGEDFQLPVLSIAADPVVLWNKYSGIYRNARKRGRRWEREADIEFFQDKKSQPLRLSAELRIHGGDPARRRSQKQGFRATYTGDSSLANGKTGFLMPLPGQEKTVVIRQLLVGPRSRLGDELFHTLYSDAGGNFPESLQSLLVLNGQMWGFYRIYERVDEKYLRRHFGGGPYDLIDRPLAAARRAVSGNLKNWLAVVDEFKTQDLSQPDAFQRASEVLDIEKTQDLWLFNIYAGNYDWPHNNLFAYRKQGEPQSKWSWIAWDADLAFFRVEQNTLEWSTRNRPRTDLVPKAPAWWRDREEDADATLIMRSLLHNEDFKRDLIRRFCDLLNTTFRAEHVERVLNEIIKAKESDLDVEWERWPQSKEQYERDLQSIRDFIYQRPEIVIEHFKQKFELSEPVTISLYNDPPDGGTIRINTVTPTAFPWIGRYFPDVSLEVEATPLPGYRFVGWTSPVLKKETKIIVTLKNDLKLGAIFQKAEGENSANVSQNKRAHL
jgi:hypothetical protein